MSTRVVFSYMCCTIEKGGRYMSFFEMIEMFNMLFKFYEFLTETGILEKMQGFFENMQGLFENLPAFLG